MKKYLKLFPLLFFGIGFSQVGINTTNPSSNSALYIDAANNNGNLEPTSETVKDDVIFTKEGKIGIGIITPKVKLDVRSEDINRNNTIGIGSTNQLASQVGEGAIRYLPINGGVMQYSDGTKWIQMKTPDVEKTSVVARILKVPFQTQHQFGNQFKDVTDFNIVSDNKNTFDKDTGVFTAPNDGNFLVTFGYDFVNFWVEKNGIIEVQFVVDNGENKSVVRKCVRSLASYGSTSSITNARPSQVGGLCVGAVSLNAGNKLSIQLRQTTRNGGILSMRVNQDPANSDAGFNNLTILEQ